MIRVEQIAQEIIDDMDLADKTIAQVSTWIRANVGRINNLTALSLSLDSNLEFTPQINDAVKDIIKCSYAVRYLKNLAKNSLLNAASTIVSMSDDVSSVRFANVNEVAKSYRMLAKEEEEKLAEMSKAFRYHEGKPQTYVAPSLCSTIAPQHYDEGDNSFLR